MRSAVHLTRLAAGLVLLAGVLWEPQVRSNAGWTEAGAVVAVGSVILTSP